MFKQVISAFFLVSALSPFAFAEDPEIRLFLEPKVGFGSAGVKYKSGSINSDTTGANTVFVSTVMGWTANDLYFGADLRYDNAIGAVEDGSFQDSINVFSLGLGFGYTMEYIPLRWYLALDIQQRVWNSKSSSGMSSAVETGGTRFGLSYYINEKFLLNFDFSEPYFKASSSTGDSVRASIYGLSLSVPIDFERETVPWRERRGYVSDVKPNSVLENIDTQSELREASNPPADDNFGDDLDESPEEPKLETATSPNPPAEEFSEDPAEASVEELNLEEEQNNSESEDELSL